MITLKPLVNELKKIDLTRGGNDRKLVLAFRGHLFIVEDKSKIRKIKAALKKHPALKNIDRDEDDAYEYLNRVAEAAPDILVGEWYPDKKGLVIWNLQEIDPHTSLQAKKVAKELGVKTVTFRYTDYISKDDTKDKDISVKKLKGKVPRVMFHGTSTRELKSMLKYGLDPGRGRSRFATQRIFHPDHVFVAATFEHAQFYASNAVTVDRSNKQGWDSFPIIIELELPDPSLLVPDYDADSTAGTKSYFNRVNPAPNPTVMKAMGVSREVGKWGYNGRIPSSFFKWVYYYNPYHKKWHKSRPEVWERLLDNYDLETIGWKLGMQGYDEEKPKYGQFWQ